MDLVHSVAARVYRSTGGRAEFDELLSLATQGWLEAQRRYQPDRGASFSTFAYYRIQGAIYDGLRRDRDPAARQRARRAARKEHGRAPAGPTPVPAHPRSEAPVDDEYLQLMSSWAVNESTGTAERHAGARQLHALVAEAVRALPTRERRLVEKHYFEGASLHEAARAIGVSKSWASRIHARAMQRLRAALDRLDLSQELRAA
jgi:RNA polymerase sigma factor for flagellar operon FliA